MSTGNSALFTRPGGRCDLRQRRIPGKRSGCRAAAGWSGALPASPRPFLPRRISASDSMSMQPAVRRTTIGEPARRIPLPGCVKARAMLRPGSAWYDLERRRNAVTERGMEPRSFVFCTDDCHSGTLVRDWHLDRVVHHTMDCDGSPLVALRMATLNTAQHLELERERGSIAPGQTADLILTDYLSRLPILAGCSRGNMLAEKGEIRIRTSEPRIDDENHPCVLGYEHQ